MTSGSDSTSEFLLPALVTRTSSELLGRRPLPHVLRERPILFVLGPVGVGKTTVARRILGDPAATLEANFRTTVVAAARHRSWAPELRQAPALLFDEVDFLHNRLGAQELLGGLLRERALAGRRTILCQGGPTDTSVTLLYPAVPFALRATLLLRFPVGRGRRRHVAGRCLVRGLSYAAAREAVVMEPWSYAAVERFLDGLPSA